MSEEGRRMIFPYTLTQQIKHFPFKFHWKQMSQFRFIFYAWGACLPLFYYFEKLTYTPSNVEKYESYLRKQKEEHEAHMHGLEKYYGESHGH